MSKDNFKKKFGKRVNFFRKENKLTQVKLGILIDRTEETISNIERGLNFPKPEIIEPLAKALKTSVENLFNFPLVENKRGNTSTKTQLLKELISLGYKLDEKKVLLLINQAKGLEGLK